MAEDKKCESCGTTENLTNHHIRKPLTGEVLRKKVLCRKCHDKKHFGIVNVYGYSDFLTRIIEGAKALEEKLPVSLRITVVADDFKGYGEKTFYVGKTGTIIGWKPNPHRADDGKIPIIKFDSGQILCDPKLWWQKLVVEGNK